MKSLITPILLAATGFVAVAAWNTKTAPVHVAEATDAGPVVLEVARGSGIYATFYRDEKTGSRYQLESDGSRIYATGTPEWVQRMKDRGFIPADKPAPVAAPVVEHVKAKPALTLPAAKAAFDVVGIKRVLVKEPGCDPHDPDSHCFPPPPPIYVQGCETPDELELWKTGGLRDPSCHTFVGDDSGDFFKLIRKDDARRNGQRYDLVKSFLTGRYLYVHDNWRTRFGRS